MICADTNVWIAFFEGKPGKDVNSLDGALLSRTVRMIPVVLAELLSDPELSREAEVMLLGVERLPLSPAFWERAGWLRADLFAKGYRPKLMDTLIAQACIDHDLPLLTRDAGFKPFAKHGGLRLA